MSSKAKEEEEVKDDEVEVDPTEKMTPEQKIAYVKDLEVNIGTKLSDFIVNQIDLTKVCLLDRALNFK